MIHRYIILLILPCLVLISGCDSSGSSPAVGSQKKDNGDNIPATMEAIIQGARWTAASATANNVLVEGVLSLSIKGRADTADELTLILVGKVVPGTYVIGGGHLASISFLPAGEALNEAFVSTIAGSVTFTQITEQRLIGTFAFEASRDSDGVSITAKSGSFNVGFGLSI